MIIHHVQYGMSSSDHFNINPMPHIFELRPETDAELKHLAKVINNILLEEQYRHNKQQLWTFRGREIFVSNDPPISENPQTPNRWKDHYDRHKKDWNELIAQPDLEISAKLFNFCPLCGADLSEIMGGTDET